MNKPDPPLDVSGLLPADLPQTPRLVRVAADMWADPNVAALWLGGSLARHAADVYSDVDLRIAVRPEAFDAGAAPASAGAVTEHAVVHFVRSFGSDATLHHLLLSDGQIYDLFVQSAAREPSPESRLVLACRDAALSEKLSAGASDPETRFEPADPNEMRQIIETFWISQVKHVKVLFRGLGLLAWEGEHRLRQDLVRLWFALATGEDCGPGARLSIHAFSPVARAIRRAAAETGTSDPLALIGDALRTPAEIAMATARLRDEYARVGRLLADKLGFAYPDAAEDAARRVWQRFVFGDAVGPAV